MLFGHKNNHVLFYNCNYSISQKFTYVYLLVSDILDLTTFVNNVNQKTSNYLNISHMCQFI